MSILQRLRDALPLRPHHEQPTSESQYPIASRGFGRLFQSKWLWKERDDNTVTELTARYRFAIRPLGPKSTFWSFLLDRTSPILAPTRIVARTNDDVTNVSITGATASPIPTRKLGRLFALKSQSEEREFPFFRFPCLRTRGLRTAVPSLRPQSILRTFLKDVISGSLLTGSISNTSNTEDGIHANVPATRGGPTACPPLAQLKTEHRASPPNTLLSYPHSPSATSLDDLASAEIVSHAPHNEDRGAENVLAVEATIAPQTARILDLPNELLCEIMAYLLSTEPLYAPTHLRLLAPRHVCRRLRNAAEQEIPVTLNALHHHFDTSKNLELRRWLKRCAESQDLRDAVSFQVDTRYSSDLDLDLLNDFVGALLNCRQARIETQGSNDGRPVGALPITTPTVVPPSHIHSFSWISGTLGIRDPIPLDNFPWRVLMNDLPWAQLTHLSLDCPLSNLDALQILSNGQAAFESVSLKLTENLDLLPHPVALPSLRSLTIDTRVPVRNFFLNLSLSALESLELKSPICTDEESPILNEHLDVPWSQLKSLSLSNQDHGERRRCPVTAVLMKCSQLQRFKWEGPSRAFEISTMVLSFVMSSQLKELIVKSDLQGCRTLLKTLLYDGNVIARVDLSHFDIMWKFPHLTQSLPYWTDISVSEGVTLLDLSKILIIGKNLTNAVFQVLDGATSSKSEISCPHLKELRLWTSIRTPSLWERLQTTQIESVQVTFGGTLLDRRQVLHDMAPFLQRYPDLPSLLIFPVRCCTL